MCVAVAVIKVVIIRANLLTSGELVRVVIRGLTSPASLRRRVYVSAHLVQLSHVRRLLQMVVILCPDPAQHLTQVILGLM